jgi:dienelactone hydrolase
MRLSILPAAAALIALVTAAAPPAARAAIKTQEVEYRHGDVVLLGYLAYDDAAAGKRPGVLIAHEWGGHNDYVRRRAEQLAQLGYVAFALDMYGKGVKAANPQEASEMAGRFKADRGLMRGRAAAGLAELRKQPMVDRDRIAAMGYCFGGTVALELARSGADLDGVVAFHAGLATPAAADAKNVKGKVLVCHGAEDPFVSDAEVAAFRDEMRDAKIDYEIIAFGGAVHSFTNSDADKAGIKGSAYNEKADRRSWAAMQAFFKEIFAGGGDRKEDRSH